MLVTVTDRKIAVSAGGSTIDYYTADISSANDYYPFGMQQPGRKFNAGGYRYGFIGVENDNEISGTGNSQDHKYRGYDPRLGRYKSVDPLFKSFPWNSSYAYAENRVIDGLDLEGVVYQKIWFSKTSKE